MALRRFLWNPLEQRSGRMIPNVVKIMSSVVIYALSFAGITALVLDEPLTSLLATSGLLAMVIGLAIQANIANVFSGIVLNVERPFKVGDYIKVNDIVGRVTDITWRTTRIESNDGPAISLANALISEAQVSNLSQLPHGYIAETDLNAPADCDPDLVLTILKEAVAQSNAVILKDDPTYSPRVRYLGVVSKDYVWVARFNARYRVESLPKRDVASDQIWRYLAGRFKEKGIPLAPVTGEEGVLFTPDQKQLDN
jgi:potassium efflux system protein